MALLGDDRRRFELARKQESHGVWCTWLGDSLYSRFIHFLSSSSAWDAFMRADSSAADSDSSRVQLHLQLRVRALLFDKASVSLFLRSTTQSSSSSSSSWSSNAISKLNPNYLQLHGDDVYFTLEEAAQRPDTVIAAANAAPSKNKYSFGVGSRFSDSEIGSMSQRFERDELPETWVAEKHRRKRVTFKEDQNSGVGNSVLESGSNMLSTSAVETNIALDDEESFFPETMFTMNCAQIVLSCRNVECKTTKKWTSMEY